MAKKRGYIGELEPRQTNNLTQLNEYFRNFFLFTNLKLFVYYSKVVPQLGNEYEIMIKQLIAIATFFTHIRYTMDNLIHLHNL